MACILSPVLKLIRRADRQCGHPLHHGFLPQRHPVPNHQSNHRCHNGLWVSGLHRRHQYHQVQQILPRLPLHLLEPRPLGVEGGDHINKKAVQATIVMVTILVSVFG
ncbi:hypothetical protein TIFTF001_011009 [Ficus carica]|uniref:Uncharacterized protein n=1 Tax=Ficus carica TaxID=3494 RepID=A0AA88DHT1_FICCA|nr:hypothetical protein TIFTF001_011009 [Ficus carica]